MATYNATEYANRNALITFAQLTASAEASDSVKLTDTKERMIYNKVLFQVTVASINTNVVVRAQGSLDNSNWFNIDTDEEDVTITANGTYGIKHEGDGELVYIRLYKVSESGGTDSTIDTKVKIFGEPSGYAGNQLL